MNSRTRSWPSLIGFGRLGTPRTVGKLCLDSGLDQWIGSIHPSMPDLILALHAASTLGAGESVAGSITHPTAGGPDLGGTVQVRAMVANSSYVGNANYPSGVRRATGTRRPSMLALCRQHIVVFAPLLFMSHRLASYCLPIVRFPERCWRWSRREKRICPRVAPPRHWRRTARTLHSRPAWLMYASATALAVCVYSLVNDSPHALTACLLVRSPFPPRGRGSSRYSPALQPSARTSSTHTGHGSAFCFS